MSEQPPEESGMLPGILSLEKAALERLTQDRLASGSLGPEVEELLFEAGVYWDTLNQAVSYTHLTLPTTPYV